MRWSSSAIQVTMQLCVRLSGCFFRILPIGAALPLVSRVY